MSRLLDLDEFLDPKSLTPQELYKLQSETWAQGAEYERERIIKLLENEEWHHIAFATRDPDDEPTKYHDGECFGCRQIALIKGEQK